MDCWWKISSLNMIFPGFRNGFYWLTLIDWAPPSDLLRVVQCKLQPSCCSYFSLIYMLYAVLCLSKLYCTAFCILVYVISDMFFVFVCTHASLNECVFDAYMKLIPGRLPSPTLVVSYQYTPQPFWSPALVMRPTIWDLLMFSPTKTSKWRKSTEQHLDEKMDKYFCKSLRLQPLKVVPRTSPPPPCSTNYCFKQKGELCSGE